MCTEHKLFWQIFANATFTSGKAGKQRYEILICCKNNQHSMDKNGKYRNEHEYYLKFNEWRLEHIKSTSFKFVERLRLILDKCRKFAIERITTFLMFGHPVQLRTSSRRPDCSLISSFLAGAQFGGQKSTGISTELQSSDPHTNSCKFVHPFKFTLTKFLQNARRSSIAVCPMDE